MGRSHLVHSISLLLIFLLHLSNNCVISSPDQSSAPIINYAPDKLTLLAFKSAIGGGDPFGRLVQWNQSLHFCRWPGVTCGGRHHPYRVRALELDSMNLTGPIPPCLSNLTFLRRLSLNENQFYGPIPWELGHLSQLQHLNLSFNSLGGNIPASLSHCSHLQAVSLRDNMLQGRIPFGLGLGGNCSELQIIMLRNNQLQGEIPSNLSRCSKLQEINLQNNMLVGEIPSEIGNLSSSLMDLDLAYNSLSGVIPPSFGKLSSLFSLVLSFNELSGMIPTSIYNISGLITLDLGYNKFYGTIPKDIGYMLPNLVYLFMKANRFHGPLPVSLANASQLENIELQRNRFSGTIPRNLAALQGLSALELAKNKLVATEAKDWNFLHVITNSSSSLQALDLSFNLLGGTLPTNFVTTTNSTSLTWLTLDHNHLSGTLPSWIWNLRNLETLDLSGNMFVGSIPPEIRNLHSLYQLYVDENQLSGELPPTLGDLTGLNTLDMGENYLTGSIPPSLGNCRQLNLLNLSYNQLSGPIPKEVLGISSLSMSLDLSHNSLTGALPSEVGSLKNLQEFRVSDNKLSGEIPRALGQCQILEFLYMDGNFFHGNIPLSLSGLRGIQVVDLSRNNLSGPIPEFLEGLRVLYYLNLSFNNFEGQVAKDGVFGNASGISVLGNNKLCGGIPQLHLSPCSIQKKSHRSHLIRLILPIAVVVLCLILLSLCLTTSYWLHKSSRKSLATTALVKNYHLTKVSYQELLKATDGFSPANLIGVGSFGSVYKGLLGDIQNVVAVKVLNLQRRGALKNFTAECEALRNIRHRNLVRILTLYSGIDFNGNEFKALVFEFMSNGSLDMWLHPEENDQHELRNLSLIQRLNIAKDVATAIEYLYHHGHIPVVHCDLKPSNILLDDEMVARVGDFGLARLLSDTNTMAPQDETSSSTLKGSVGYIAPEYGMTNKVSTQGDVYSYGILLLEIFTRKRPTDDIFKEGLCLRQYVVASFSGKLMDIVDPCLFKYEKVGDISENITRRKSIDCITSMLKIGLCCTEDSPSDRINMGDVTKKVQLVIDSLEI